MDIKEAMKQALELERKGREYYTEIANSANNKFVKDVFTFIAEQEVYHEKEIKGYIDSSSIKLEDDHDVEIKTFFNRKIDEFKGEMKASTEHTEAYEKAMQLEKDAYNFYKEQHENADTDELKTFLEFLMQQESNHYLLFRNALEYLNNPESYHMEQEDWNFEG